MPTRNLSDEERGAIGSWCHEEMRAGALIALQKITIPETKLLTLDEVGEIEAAQVKRRESLAFHQGEYPGLPSPPYIEEIAALCATVRALETDVERFSTLADERHDLLSEERRRNDGLREHVDTLQRSNETLTKRNVELRAQLAAAVQERDALRKHVTDLNHDLEATIKEMNEMEKR